MYQHHEIAIKNKEKALEVLGILVDEEYCVMFSREEDLYIINYEYSEYSDRNNIVFMSKDEFEEKYIETEE